MIPKPGKDPNTDSEKKEETKKDEEKKQDPISSELIQQPKYIRQSRIIMMMD